MGPSALSRARATLLEHLSPAQRAEFERTGAFTVRGKWGRRYKVNSRGEVRGPGFLWFRARFGIWPCCYSMPREDYMLAMKLLLEADEHAFRAKACWCQP